MLLLKHSRLIWDFDHRNQQFSTFIESKQWSFFKKYPNRLLFCSERLESLMAASCANLTFWHTCGVLKLMNDMWWCQKFENAVSIRFGCGNSVNAWVKNNSIGETENHNSRRIYGFGIWVLPLRHSKLIWAFDYRSLTWFWVLIHEQNI